MGIRVHKCLGYGLADVRNEHFKITDPRINTASWLLTHEAVPTLADYQAWLTDHACSEFSMDQSAWMLGDKPRALDDCAVYSPEFGLPEVLVLQPLAMDNWSRFDDTIDYVTETHLREPSQAHRVEPICEGIPIGIYPYNGRYMDSRTGKRLDDTIMWWIRAANSSELVRPQVLDALAQAAGLDSHADAIENVAPVVPEEIRDLAGFAELFTDDTAWRQLRPLLYTYWG